MACVHDLTLITSYRRRIERYVMDAFTIELLQIKLDFEGSCILCTVISIESYENS